MFSRFSTLARRPAQRLFSTAVKLELKSGRIGLLKLQDQEDFDKMLHRSSGLGLVADAEEDPIDIITSIGDLQKDTVYHLAFGFDEQDVFDEEDMEEDGEEQEK